MYWIYDYWLYWRQAYHDARELYHKEMARFYGEQIKVKEEWVKSVMNGYDNISKMFTMKLLENVIPSKMMFWPEQGK